MLAVHDVDVASLSEVETAGPFAVEGYNLYYPLTSGKARVLILVKAELAVCANARLAGELMWSDFPSVWIKLDAHHARNNDRRAQHGALLVGAVYRPWRRGDMAAETAELSVLREQIERAGSNHSRIVLSGDFNIDLTKKDDPKYRCKTLMEDLGSSVANAGLVCHKTPHTWSSYGLFGKEAQEKSCRSSTIDHVYTAGINADVKVLSDATTDHRPLVTSIAPRGCQQQLADIGGKEELQSTD
jgi:hypothetical protein